MVAQQEIESDTDIILEVTDKGSLTGSVILIKSHMKAHPQREYHAIHATTAREDRGIWQRRRPKLYHPGSEHVPFTSCLQPDTSDGIPSMLYVGLRGNKSLQSGTEAALLDNFKSKSLPMLPPLDLTSAIRISRCIFHGTTAIFKAREKCTHKSSACSLLSGLFMDTVPTC